MQTALPYGHGDVHAQDKASVEASMKALEEAAS
jgi:hypothetical protein